MQTISKSKLKAHMLRVLREIEENGEELIVTDRNRPALRIQPIKEKMIRLFRHSRIFNFHNF